jgi:hypothetical protein
MADMVPHIYLLPTTHIFKVKNTDKRFSVFSGIQLWIHEGVDMRLSKANFAKEPLLVLFLKIYIRGLYLCRKNKTETRDFESVRYLLSKSGSTFKEEQADSNMDDLINLFHKRRNYLIQGILFFGVFFFCLLFLKSGLLLSLTVSILMLVFIYTLFFLLYTFSYRNNLVVDTTISRIKEGYTSILVSFGDLHIDPLLGLFNKKNKDNSFQVEVI